MDIFKEKSYLVDNLFEQSEKRIVYYPGLEFDVKSVYNITHFDKLISVSKIDYNCDGEPLFNYIENKYGEIDNDLYYNYYEYKKKYLITGAVNKLVRELKIMGAENISIVSSYCIENDFKKTNNKIIIDIFEGTKICCDINIPKNKVIYYFTFEGREKIIEYYYEYDIYEFDNNLLQDANIFFTKGSISKIQINEKSFEDIMIFFPNVKIFICDIVENLVDDFIKVHKNEYYMIDRFEAYETWGMCVFLNIKNNQMN